MRMLANFVAVGLASIWLSCTQGSLFSCRHRAPHAPANSKAVRAAPEPRRSYSHSFFRSGTKNEKVTSTEIVQIPSSVFVQEVDLDLWSGAGENSSLIGMKMMRSVKVSGVAGGPHLLGPNPPHADDERFSCCTARQEMRSTSQTGT